MAYKDLSEAKVIAVDIETYDPGISEDMGPGVYRNDGYILGVAVADTDGYAEYFNLGHYDCTEKERNSNIEYLREVLALDIPKLGANIVYDVDWLENWVGDTEKFGWRGEGPMLKVNGLLYDIQVAEPLIDENQGKYSLDYQAKKYLGRGKYKTEIDKFCEENGLKGDPRQWLYKMPYMLVYKYAIEDVHEPIEIFRIQWKLLNEENLLELFHLETRLLRAIIKMRKTGVRIDQRKRDRNALKSQNEMEEVDYRLREQYGTINYNSSKQLAELFDKLDIDYNFKLTCLDDESKKIETIVPHAEGRKYARMLEDNPIVNCAYGVVKTCNPTLPKEYLKKISEENPIVKDIMFIRKADRMINSFLMGSLTKFVCKDGLIHPSIYNVRNDEFGTRSGRLSMGNPNLQQIPSKGVDEYWGTVCREVFIPFDNCWWAKLDYSQIEYRILANFATGPGAKELVDSYNDNPLIDYHQYIMDLTSLKRRFAKNLNFGVAYGMGKNHMAEFFNWTLEYAEEILSIYHTKAPYVRSTVKRVEQVAKTRGYIRTILGRRSRLVDKNKAYIMFCRLIQGSAADMMKKGMVDVYESDVFDYIYAHLTVHDELDFSVPKKADSVRALFKARDLMQDAVPLKVPVKADVEIGTNWATVVELDVSKSGMSEKDWLDSLTDENVVEKVESLMGESLNK